MPAPRGNNNASVGKEWTDAIRYAVANYEKGTIKRGQALKAIAKSLVERAIAGDKDAWQEIGNRYDGKPVQAIAGTGDKGEIIVEIVKFANSTTS